MSSQELAHFGVKGMRWGHRKAAGLATAGNSGSPAEQMKANRQQLRAQARGNYSARGQQFGKVFKSGLAGGALASAMVASGAAAGPAIVASTSGVLGYNMMRSTGYGRGASAVVGYIGGAPGGLLASELRVRKLAKQGVTNLNG